MLFWPSPAQPASASGSSRRIAARFVDILTCNPSVESPTPVMFLDRPRAKWNSLLGHRVIRRYDSSGPRPLRSNGAGRHGFHGRGGAMWIEPAAAEYPQPRLVADTTCLIVGFENWCVFNAPIFL